MKRPLILPSSHHPTAEVCVPRTDFTLLSESLGKASLLFPPKTGDLLMRPLERRTASDLRQAILAYRRHSSVSVYVSFSEKIGLPLALLLKAGRQKTPHVLVAHHLTSERKTNLQEKAGWLNTFARIVVLSKPQAVYLQEAAKYPESRILLLPDSIDTNFWSPQGNRTSAHEPFVLSVGQERRDYNTLFAAARELPSIPFVIVPGSTWTTQNQRRENLPPNVTLRHDLSYTDLRALYDHAAVVVVPLEANVSYAAGANGLLEAMSMGKPIILSETPGLKDYLQDSAIVHRIPPASPNALVQAIQKLWEIPRESRQSVAKVKHSLENYVAALAHLIREVEAEYR
jgi:glycosyltransferase involved in cell wall biosynthesis